jgi:predicted transcriptional regulator YdeE
LSYEVREEPGLTVLGLHTRASNAEPQKIGALWRSFHAAGEAKGIEARTRDTVYCIYTEYDGDFSRPYSVVIGCEVPPDAAVPLGFKKVVLGPGRFAVYAAEGELPQAVFGTWAEIWQTPLARRYEADFDRYGVNGVTVHVGIE